MPTNQDTENVIAAVLALPADERLAVMDAIHFSLVDPKIDHGPGESLDVVTAIWKDEIAQRIADVDSGRVKTVPAEEAERMIRGDATPSV